MGPSTQQFFFLSSDVIATTCFDHTIIIRRQTVVYCRKQFSLILIQLTATAVKQNRLRQYTTVCRLMMIV
jgi:hypothetical protein